MEKSSHFGQSYLIPMIGWQVQILQAKFSWTILPSISSISSGPETCCLTYGIIALTLSSTKVEMVSAISLLKTLKFLAGFFFWGSSSPELFLSFVSANSFFFSSWACFFFSSWRASFFNLSSSFFSALYFSIAYFLSLFSYFFLSLSSSCAIFFNLFSSFFFYLSSAKAAFFFLAYSWANFFCSWASFFFSSSSILAFFSSSATIS